MQDSEQLGVIVFTVIILCVSLGIIAKGLKYNGSSRVMKWSLGIGLLAFVSVENVLQLNGYDNSLAIRLYGYLKLFLSVVGIIGVIYTVIKRKDGTMSTASHWVQGVIASILLVLMCLNGVGSIRMISLDNTESGKTHVSDTDGFTFIALGSNWSRQENEKGYVMQRVGVPCVIQVTKMKNVERMNFDKVVEFMKKQPNIIDFNVIEKTDTTMVAQYMESINNNVANVNSKILFDEKKMVACEIIIRTSNAAKSMLVQRTIGRYNDETIKLALSTMKTD